jgi:hypothetical protein
LVFSCAEVAATSEAPREIENEASAFFNKIKTAPAIGGSEYLEELLVSLESSDPELYEDLSAAYDKFHEAHVVCGKELGERLKAKDPDYRKKIKGHKWVMYASASGANNNGKFSNPSVDASAPWPEYFDEEVKKCFLDSIQNTSFPTTKEFSYKLMFQLCSVPGSD